MPGVFRVPPCPARMSVPATAATPVAAVALWNARGCFVETVRWAEPLPPVIVERGRGREFRYGLHDGERAHYFEIPVEVPR